MDSSPSLLAPLAPLVSPTLKSTEPAALSAVEEGRIEGEVESSKGGVAALSRPLRLTTIAGPLCFRYHILYTALQCCSLPYPTLPYPTIPCPVLLCSTLPCPVPSFHVRSYPVCHVTHGAHTDDITAAIIAPVILLNSSHIVCRTSTLSQPTFYAYTVSLPSPALDLPHVASAVTAHSLPLLLLPSYYLPSKTDCPYSPTNAELPIHSSDLLLPLSGDVIIADSLLPECRPGDRCVVLDAGANTLSLFRYSSTESQTL